jgi:hypothetical protein
LRHKKRDSIIIAYQVHYGIFDCLIVNIGAIFSIKKSNW